MVGRGKSLYVHLVWLGYVLPAAYKTVSGVNGPLVILDQVKVSIRVALLPFILVRPEPMGVWYSIHCCGQASWQVCQVTVLFGKVLQRLVIAGAQRPDSCVSPQWLIVSHFAVTWVEQHCSYKQLHSPSTAPKVKSEVFSLAC